MEQKIIEEATPEQIADAKKILDACARVPVDKKPVIFAILNAFISGMESQERLNKV